MWTNLLIKVSNDGPFSEDACERVPLTAVLHQCKYHEQGIFPCDITAATSPGVVIAFDDVRNRFPEHLKLFRVEVSQIDCGCGPPLS